MVFVWYRITVLLQFAREPGGQIFEFTLQHFAHFASRLQPSSRRKTRRPKMIIAVFHQPMKQLDPWNPRPKIWKLLSTNINQLIYYSVRRWQGKPEHCCTAQYCSFRFDFDAQISTDIVLWQTKLEQEISTFYWKIIYQNLSLEFIGYHLSRNGGALSFPGLGRDVIFCKVPPGRTGGVLGALIFSSSRRFAVERQIQIKSGRHAQATDRKQGRPLGWRFDLWVPNWVNVDLWSIMPPPVWPWIDF